MATLEGFLPQLLFEVKTASLGEVGCFFTPLTYLQPLEDC